MKEERTIHIAVSYLDPPSHFPDNTKILRTAINIVLEDNESNFFFIGNSDNRSQNLTIDDIYSTNQDIVALLPIGSYKLYVISGIWDEIEIQLKYALAIVGDFVRESVQKVTDDELTCPMGCNGNGICNKGRCDCFSSYAGTMCQLDVIDYDEYQIKKKQNMALIILAP